MLALALLAATAAALWARNRVRRRDAWEILRLIVGIVRSAGRDAGTKHEQVSALRIALVWRLVVGLGAESADPGVVTAAEATNMGRTVEVWWAVGVAAAFR